MVDGDEVAPERLATLRRATELLSSLREESTGCPQGADRFDWSADVLDQIARLVCEVAPTIEHETGQPNDVLRASAEDLATAIVAHRNGLMRAPGGLGGPLPAA